jgi:hypothetical protein
MQQQACEFCPNPVDDDDPDTYREVKSWVHGPKLDHPVMREQTGKVAHGDCVRMVMNGVAPGTEPLF